MRYTDLPQCAGCVCRGEKEASDMNALRATTTASDRQIYEVSEGRCVFVALEVGVEVASCLGMMVGEC